MQMRIRLLCYLSACQIAQERNVRPISVVNVVGSLLARLTNCGVYLNAGREVAVASTKSFTSQVVVLSLIATWFAQHRVDDKSSYDSDYSTRAFTSRVIQLLLK